MLAAKAGMKKETMAFVLDHRDEPQFFSAFCISKSFIKHNEAVDTSEFEEVIAELAKEGHILSKQFEFKKKVAHLGILSGILELGFSISLLPTVFKISIHNISDPRLDRKAGVSR